MALLPILHFPDPRLQKVAQPVQAVDGRIRTLVADMLETMYEAKGIGLAATQIDVHERVIVIDVSEERNQPIALIDAELLCASEERVKGEEGAKSRPMACWPCAFSMKWTTSRAGCSSITSPPSNATASKPRCSRPNAWPRSRPRKPPDGHRWGPVHGQTAGGKARFKDGKKSRLRMNQVEGMVFSSFIYSMMS